MARAAGRAGSRSRRACAPVRGGGAAKPRAACSSSRGNRSSAALPGSRHPALPGSKAPRAAGQRRHLCRGDECHSILLELLADHLPGLRTPKKRGAGARRHDTLGFRTQHHEREGWTTGLGWVCLECATSLLRQPRCRRKAAGGRHCALGWPLCNGPVVAHPGRGGPHAIDFQATRRALCLDDCPHRLRHHRPLPHLPAGCMEVHSSRGRGPGELGTACPPCRSSVRLAGSAVAAAWRRRRHNLQLPLRLHSTAAALAASKPTNLQGPLAVKALQPAGRCRGWASASCMAGPHRPSAAIK